MRKFGPTNIAAMRPLSPVTPACRMPGLIAATLPLIDVDSTTTTGLLTAAATGPGVAAVELPADELCASTPAETLKPIVSAVTVSLKEYRFMMSPGVLGLLGTWEPSFGKVATGVPQPAFSRAAHSIFGGTPPA